MSIFDPYTKSQEIKKMAAHVDSLRRHVMRLYRQIRRLRRQAVMIRKTLKEAKEIKSNYITKKERKG